MKNHCDCNSGDAGGVALGRQLTVEFYECSSAILADAKGLEEVFLRAAKESGAHVITSVFHGFEPQGVSGVVVISESHFAVHAWPEHDYAAVDIFTCGSGVDFETAVKALAKGMKSRHWIVSGLVNRGILGESGVERLIPVAENSDNNALQLSWRERFCHTGARAISCCIDIYGCKAALFESYTLEKLAAVLAEKLEPAGTAAKFECSSNGERVDFCCKLSNIRIDGMALPDKRALYLNVFSDGFTDPRPLAEAAMVTLLGNYYRMQVMVRQ